MKLNLIKVNCGHCSGTKFEISTSYDCIIIKCLNCKTISKITIAQSKLITSE